MTTPASSVLILYSLPTDVQGAKLDEQIKEIEVDIGRIHDAIGRRAAYDSVQSLSDVAAVLDDYPEAKVVFNLVEEMPGGPDEVESVPMICRAFGKKCTGNRHISRDKFLTNCVLKAHGILAPDAALAAKDFTVIEDIPDGKLIIKPTMGGGSEGITAANVIDDHDNRERNIRKVVAHIHAKDQDAILEEFIDGREITAGIIVRDGKPFVLPLLETKMLGETEVQSYQAKWAEGSKEHQQTPTVCPADLPAPLADSIRQSAIEAWQACGCTSYCRIDFRASHSSPYCIDVNDNPDLSVDGGIVEMLEKAGIKFETFIRDLVDQAQ
jgi:D-alanine-D-alanine ligase-like ATP-grasp enzyme